MTRLHLQAMRDAIGIPVATKVIFQATATRIRVDGALVTFPVPVREVLSPGENFVDLAETDPTWAWTIEVAPLSASGRPTGPMVLGTYYLNGTDVDFADLVRVDPHTVDDAPAAWWIEAQRLQAQINAIPGGGGGGAVASVNGKVGAVVLTPADLGAQPAGSYAAAVHTHTLAQIGDASAFGRQLAKVADAAAGRALLGVDSGGGTTGVSSVNGKTGDVTLVPADLGAQPAGSYATTTALTTGLAGKSNTGHSHVQADVSGLPAALTGLNDLITALNLEVDSKQDAGDYATTAALTAGLATKQPTGSYATTQQLTDGLATKQAVGSYATTQNLSDGLATKAATVHTHTMSQISDSTATGRALLAAADAAAARTAIGAGTGSSNLAIGTTGTTAKAGNWFPALAEVTGLQSALDAKQAAGNYATVSYVDAQVAAVPRFIPVANIGDAAVTGAPVGSVILVAA